jgi:uncharacterized membrane protein
MVAPTAALFARRSTSAPAAALAALGEMLVDKLPVAPARTALPSLTFRIVTGAVSAGAEARRLRIPLGASAIAGAIGAAGATYLAYGTRSYLTRRRHWPDLPVALVEDALAAALIGIAHRGRERG